MSQITVAWKASEELQKREYTATGEKPDANRKFQLDLVELKAAQRKPIVEHLGLHCYVLDMKTTHDFNEKFPASSYLPSYSQDYDHQPTLSDILSYVALEADARNEAQAHEAKVNAAKKANQKRLQAAYDKLRPEIEALAESGELEAMESLSFLTKDSASFKPSSGDRKTLGDLLRAGIKAARKAKWLAHKKAWIKAYGSSHLQRAFAGGYDAQRLYVTERAAMEALGFTVDFNDWARWNDRSCPSLAALDAETEAEKLGVGEPVMVVWLTRQAVDSVDDEDHYYDFEECEAVVIQDYLGRYDLVREL